MSKESESAAPTPTTSTPSDAGSAPALLSLFATPVINHRFEGVDALNAALRTLITKVAAGNAGSVTSNVGGYQTAHDFMNWEVECVRELRERLQQLVVDATKRVLRPGTGDRKVHFELDGWANLMRRGDYQVPHCHPDHFWSGIYYVTANEAVEGHPFSGKLELLDPRAGANTADARDTSLYGRSLLNPVAGQVLVFPAWLQHYVHPCFGAQERISIAFNVGFEFGA